MKRLPDQEAEEFMKLKGLEPLVPYPNSTSNWLCRCMRCGSQTSPRLSDLRTGKSKTGCQNCGGNRPLQEEVARSILETAGFKPLEPFRGVDYPWASVCMQCGKQSSPTISTIRSGSGCGWCAGQFIDLDHVHKKMAAAFLEPLEPYPGGKKNWKCRCSQCGRTVFPRFNNIDQGWGGCGICAGRRVDPQIAISVMIEAGLHPLVSYPGNQSPWRCIHVACGKEVTPTYNSIKFGQGGCRFCSVSGLKWDQPTVLYLATNSLFQKIGVANSATLQKRLGMHQRAGLEPIALFQFGSGEEAYSIEQTVVAWWRDEHESGPVPKELLPDGWTETVFSDQVPLSLTLSYLTGHLSLEQLVTDRTTD